MKKLFRKLKSDRDRDDGRRQSQNSVNASDLSRASSKHVVDATDRVPHYPPRPQPQPRNPDPPPPEPAGNQDELTTFSGFDSWLSSFTPDPQQMGLSELQDVPMANDVLRIEGFPEYDYISVSIQNVRKEDHQQTFLVTVSGPWYMTLNQVNQVLGKHGYKELVFARHPQSKTSWDGSMARYQYYQIPVVQGPSCYDPDVGLFINEDEPLHSFLDGMRRLKLSCRDGRLVVSSFPASLEIDFNRTLRLPESGTRIHDQPSGLGVIPVNNISAITKKLMASQNSSLMDMAKKGGIFFPLYQREAVFVTFKANKDTFALRVFVGGVNAVSGLTWNSTPKGQDYLVVPPQTRLDGVAVGDGTVKQFVAMPLGSRYSVEKQVTGRETIGGLQLEITPGDLWRICPKGIEARVAQPNDTPRTLGAEFMELRVSSHDVASATNADLLDDEDKDEWPVYMKHLYLEQFDDLTYVCYGKQPTQVPGFARWQAGAHVQMIAVYKFQLTLMWHERGELRTSQIEWCPWWDLFECILERHKAGFKFNGQDLIDYDMLLGNGPGARILVNESELQIQQQGVRDGDIIFARVKDARQPERQSPSDNIPFPASSPGGFGNPVYQQQTPYPPGQAASSWQAPPIPQQSQLSGERPQAPPGSSFGAPASPGSSGPALPYSYNALPEGRPYTEGQLAHDPATYSSTQSQPSYSPAGYGSAAPAPGPSPYSPANYFPSPGTSSHTATPGFGSGPSLSEDFESPGNSGDASYSRPSFPAPPARPPQALPPMSPGLAPPPRPAHGLPPPPSIPAPPQQGFAAPGYSGFTVSPGSSEATPSSPSRMGSRPVGSPSPTTSYNTSYGSSPVPYAHGRSQGLTARPADRQQQEQSQQQPTGWAMGIAAGATLRQQILRDPFRSVRWPKQRTTLLSVQILNAVAFEALTGMLAPPTPITAETYRACGFPFFTEAWAGDRVVVSLETDGARNLAGLQSVGDLDATGAPIRAGSNVAQAAKVACTVCRRMLCDSVLRPCNHSFCSTCIREHLTYADAVYCRICRARATQVLGISGPMALPGEDTVDLSLSKVTTINPYGGLWAFRSIQEMEGVSHLMPIRDNVFELA